MPVRESVSDKPWNFADSDYSPQQWRRACLIDMGTGDPESKGRYKVPVREPDGTLSRAGCHAAAGAHGLQGVVAPPDARRTAARALVRLYRGQLDEEPPDAILGMAGMSGSKSVDIEIEIGEDGDGCGCAFDDTEPCDVCGCTCDGTGSGACGCDCGSGGACQSCNCACNDTAGASETNACGTGKKRPRRAAMTGVEHLTDFTRIVEFRVKSDHGDGRTLTGYAAVFDTPTRIDSMFEGTFDEQIQRGAFGRYLAQRTPTLMFEHGHHPLIGSMPLGKIIRASEDAKGLYIEARLSDNWLIQPVRDAVRDGAVNGMSFRFSVPEGGDTWQDRSGDVPLRTLTDVDVPELGPVVFPAYEPTTVSVRSLLDRLPHTPLGDLPAGSGRRKGRDAGPRSRAAKQMSYDHLLLMRKWAQELRSPERGD